MSTFIIEKWHEIPHNDRALILTLVNRLSIEHDLEVD